MLAKLIPLVLIGALAYKGFNLAQNQMGFLSNFIKISTTQSELKNISSLLAVEMAADGDLPGNWMDIITEQIDAGDRDPTVDVWDNCYDAWTEDSTLSVMSAGPDGEYDTDDDIVSRSN